MRQEARDKQTARSTKQNIIESLQQKQSDKKNMKDMNRHRRVKNRYERHLHIAYISDNRL